MYLFMKGVGFTHMNLKGKCMIVYNHWKKSVKIDCAWRTFVESQILKVGIQIIFEFPDVTSNFVLF